MAEQLILIERNDRKQFSKFIELFKAKQEIPMQEIRGKIAKSTFYEIVLARIHSINESIKAINPDVGSFISPSLGELNGRIVQTMKRNCNVDIIDEDRNFFYLRVRGG